LLKDTFSPQDVFLESVCSELVFSTACYGRAITRSAPQLSDFDDEIAFEQAKNATNAYNDASYSRQAERKVDCRTTADQDVILNELKVVDCWRQRPFDVALYGSNLTIAVTVAGLFMTILYVSRVFPGASSCDYRLISLFLLMPALWVA
jgi:hypothetical protein